MGSDEPPNEGGQQRRGECKAREPVLGLPRGTALPRSAMAVRRVLPPQPERLRPLLLDSVAVGRLPRGTRHQLTHLGRYHGGRQSVAEGGSAPLEELRGNGTHLGGGHALRVGQDVNGVNVDSHCKETVFTALSIPQFAAYRQDTCC